VTLADGSVVPYATFVAPSLLAASAMNGAIYESTLNIFFKLKYGKVYDAILATPMKPVDIAVGEITWSLIRGGLYAIGFMIVMAVFGLVASWWAIMAVPAALLIGFAFASVGMAATSYMRSWQDFDMVQLVTLPLFLFSATFYPLSVYPPLVQNLTRFSPLYHGVEIIRALTLGRFDWSLAGHVGFLLVMGAIGVTVAARRIEKLLLN
jgi:lipooligosaccharide transport system permease protein